MGRSLTLVVAVVGLLAVACSAPSDYRVVERDAGLPREASLADDLGTVVDVPLGPPLDASFVMEASVDAQGLDAGPSDTSALDDDAAVDAHDDRPVLDEGMDAGDALDAAPWVDGPGADVPLDEGGTRDVIFSWDGDLTACERARYCAECFMMARAGAPCGFCGYQSTGIGRCLVMGDGGARPSTCSTWWFPGWTSPTCARSL